MTRFPHPPFRKRFSKQIYFFYFVNLDNLENLAIYDKTLRELLVDMGWTNVLVIKERVYLNLVRVFYSNMVISSQTTNRVVTNVGGISIEVM